MGKRKSSFAGKPDTSKYIIIIIIYVSVIFMGAHVSLHMWRPEDSSPRFCWVLGIKLSCQVSGANTLITLTHFVNAKIKFLI